MKEIYNFSLQVHIDYAKRIESTERFNKEYRVEQAAGIQSQTLVVTLSPKQAELEKLFGVVAIHTPWAYFFAPPLYRYQRRSPFGFFRVAPSLGSFDIEDESEKQLDLVHCETDEEKKQKGAIKGCFAQIDKINNWLSFIVGRVGQFLQG